MTSHTVKLCNFLACRIWHNKTLVCVAWCSVFYTFSQQCLWIQVDQSLYLQKSSNTDEEQWQKMTCAVMWRLLYACGQPATTRSEKIFEMSSKWLTTTCLFLTPRKRTYHVLGHGKHRLATETSTRGPIKTWSLFLTMCLVRTLHKWSCLKVLQRRY